MTKVIGVLNQTGRLFFSRTLTCNLAVQTSAVRGPAKP